MRPWGLIHCVVALSLAGCVAVHWEDEHGVLQHRGLLRYSMIHTPSARLFVQETFGLDLRFVSRDPGVSLGYRKYVAAQPQPSGSSAVDETGYFWAEDPVSNHAGLFFKKAYGGDVGPSLISNGLTLGYDRITLIVGPKAGESVITRIEFSEDALSATRYVSQQGGW